VILEKKKTERKKKCRIRRLSILHRRFTGSEKWKTGDKNRMVQENVFMIEGMQFMQREMGKGEKGSEGRDTLKR